MEVSLPPEMESIQWTTRTAWTCWGWTQASWGKTAKLKCH